MRRFLLAFALIWPAGAVVGHDDHDADPALKRYAGQIIGLGTQDAKGEIYSFRAKRMYDDAKFAPDELRGWRLTILAGKRYANVFEVRSNTGDEITVTAAKGPLNGIAVKDVFVVEKLPPDSSAARR